MKTISEDVRKAVASGILTGLAVIFSFIAGAQEPCGTSTYETQLFSKFPQLRSARAAAEAGLRSGRTMAAREEAQGIIRIPVVFHILYHFSNEDISDEIINNQIAVLNRDFRKQNADTSSIPEWFASLAADTRFEFVLATQDPKGRATTGIIHKYTPLTYWNIDDKIKFSSETGDDAWDANSYLNIWIGKFRKMEGYSSAPGDPAELDGVVLDYRFVTNSDPKKDMPRARTAVHEVGHWLGLKHIWGDSDCGDDLVDDTPRQQTFHSKCYEGIYSSSCNNDPRGEMYMNYMDYTPYSCIHMFTKGQADRMRSFFYGSGPRVGILSSKGLDKPAIAEIPTQNEAPRWLHVRLYPNPATSDLGINFDYDVRWIGQDLIVVNNMGATVKKVRITETMLHVNVQDLPAGIYYVRGNKGSEQISEKFIKH